MRIATFQLKAMSTTEIARLAVSSPYRGIRLAALETSWALQDAGLERPNDRCVWHNGRIVSIGEGE